jgi:hypothetical protein
VESSRIVESKPCKRCGQTKPISEFRIHTGSGNRIGRCHECVRQDTRDRAAGKVLPSLRASLDNPDGTRTCRLCNVSKCLDEFTLRDKVKGTRRNECHTCTSRVRAANYAANRERRRDGMRRLLYGLKPGQYEEMLNKQGGKCSICREPEASPDRHTGRARGLFVDHDHATGRVRGLLCMRCNIGVGQFRDDVDLMKLAIEYLNRNAG